MRREYPSKIKFIIKLKKIFGKDNIIEDFTGYSKISKDNDYNGELSKIINISGSFRNKNVICIKNPKNDDKFRLFFHYSTKHNFNKTFFGFNKNIIDELFNLQKIDEKSKTYSFLFLIWDSEDGFTYFLIPIYFIKTMEEYISKSKGELKLNIVFKDNKYLLMLNRNNPEDISNFKIEIKDLFDESVYRKFKEEKEKYEKKLSAKENFFKVLKNKN